MQIGLTDSALRRIAAVQEIKYFWAKNAFPQGEKTDFLCSNISKIFEFSPGYKEENVISGTLLELEGLGMSLGNTLVHPSDDLAVTQALRYQF